METKELEAKDVVHDLLQDSSKIWSRPYRTAILNFSSLELLEVHVRMLIAGDKCDELIALANHVLGEPYIFRQGSSLILKASQILRLLPCVKDTTVPVHADDRELLSRLRTL